MKRCITMQVDKNANGKKPKMWIRCSWIRSAPTIRQVKNTAVLIELHVFGCLGVMDILS
jgi:hypothetical protein